MSFICEFSNNKCSSKYATKLNVHGLMCDYHNHLLILLYNKINNKKNTRPQFFSPLPPLHPRTCKPPPPSPKNNFHLKNENSDIKLLEKLS